MVETWQDIAKATQQSILDSIPPQWQLSQSQKDSSVTDKRAIPETCGLLTPKQLEITETSAVVLLEQLRTRALSSVEVTEAFCIRAAIAHQLVRSYPIYSRKFRYGWLL
jgi:amidase